jgi:transglutaminase-like putative cysteine protease
MSARGESMRRIGWATAAFGGGVLLHIDRIPLWVTAVVVACIAWRLAAEKGVLSIPSRYVRVVVTLALVLAVLGQFRTLNGLSAGSALLAVMGSAKLLETHARRDRFIVIGAALFLLLAACLDRQSLLRAPLYLAHAWVCCAALAIVAHDTGMLTDRRALALAGRTLLLAAPLALLLFLLFPRIPGAFWALPPADQAQTGLGDTMSPGSISELTASYEPAFTAHFEGPIPPPEERYWRGPVLHEFDGFTWRRPRVAYFRSPDTEPTGPAYRHRISLEPHGRRWWFALDTPDGTPSYRRANFTYDNVLIANERVTRLTSYEVVSHTQRQPKGSLSPPARRQATQLPEERNPRSAELARNMREEAGSDEAFVDRLLDLFRTGGFEYSLEPQRLGIDSVDDFIFNTRSGFCGHYASAFASMMRAAGVPARVVTGYLGGEWNPIGEFFIVRQSDAHAWTEVWLEGRGWTRVDPTAVVEPERLTRGIIELLPNAVSAPARLRNAAPWVASVFQRWDALNNWWNQSVLRFDLAAQTNLLSSLGIEAPDVKHLGWLLAAGLVAWLLWVTWHIGISGLKTPRDALARAYLRLCQKLARVGIERAAHQGPLAYAEVVSQQRPDLDVLVRPLLTRYAELRYGPSEKVTRAEVNAFSRQVSQLRIRDVA